VRLHLIRHGDANHDRATWHSDDRRPLSRKGHTEARRCGEALRILGATPDLVLSSPLLRARETADDVCEALGGGLVPVVTDVMAPGADPDSLLSEIAIHHPGALEIVCTGHMPDMGYMAAFFSTGQLHTPFRVKTGTLIRADISDHDFRLGWYLPPKAVRKVAGSAS